MVSSVGISEAQAHLPDLLDRVAKGERLRITAAGGVPVADLVPPGQGEQAEARPSADELWARLCAFRAEVRPGPPTIRELIDEGRKY